jgi:hypothetical protein
MLPRAVYGLREVRTGAEAARKALVVLGARDGTRGGWWAGKP